MKISKITKLKNGFYEVIVDKDNEEKKFKLSEDILIEYNFFNHKVLTESEYTLLHTLANYSKIYTKTLGYIAFKMRTEYEVSIYLQEKDCNEKYINEIIEKLKRLNYINDKMYCQNYVKHQFEINKKGPKLIIDELKKKKVKLDFINESIKSLSSEMIDDKVISLVQYYDKTNRGKSINKLKESILRHLITKGFDYEVIMPILNNYSFTDNNNDRQLLQKEFTKVYNRLQKKYQDYELKNKVIKTLMNKGFNYEDITSILVSINSEEL